MVAAASVIPADGASKLTSWKPPSGSEAGLVSVPKLSPGSLEALDEWMLTVYVGSPLPVCLPTLNPAASSWMARLPVVNAWAWSQAKVLVVRAPLVVLLTRGTSLTVIVGCVPPNCQVLAPTVIWISGVHTVSAVTDFAVTENVPLGPRAAPDPVKGIDVFAGMVSTDVGQVVVSFPISAAVAPAGKSSPETVIVVVVPSFTDVGENVMVSAFLMVRTAVTVVGPAATTVHV